MARPKGIDQGSMVQALLYTRVSGAEHQREGLSLEAQTSATRKYAAERLGWVIAGEYQDIMSGKRADRPHYQAMLEHARQLHRERQRVAIVVIKLDRLGRNKAEYFRTAEELSRHGAEVHSIKDGGVLDETHASILAVFAAKEAKDIGERVGSTRKQLVDGGYHYGRVPFGYRKRLAAQEEIDSGRARRMATKDAPSHVFEPDPCTRGVAVEAFERYARGESTYAVSQWLSGLPETMRGGRAWPAQCVWGMLQSPSYVARPAEGVEDVLARPVARWEPLVSDELYDRVQQRLAGHKSRAHQASDQYLLTGFARCPQCGHNMVHSSARRGDQAGKLRGRYRCAGYLKGAAAPDRDCRYEMADDRADDAVLEQVGHVLDALSDPNYAPSLRQAWADLERPVADTSRQLASVEHELQASQKRLANAARLLVDGELDRQGYEALRDAETAAIKAAETERARLHASTAPQARRKLPPIDSVLEQAGTWGRILREVDVSRQRAILDQLVDRAVVRKAGYRQYTAEVFWNELGQALQSASDQAF